MGERKNRKGRRNRDEVETEMRKRKKVKGREERLRVSEKEREASRDLGRWRYGGTKAKMGWNERMNGFKLSWVGCIG